jgi:hypothetical protein
VGRKADRQAGRQTDRQANRQADIHEKHDRQAFYLYVTLI